MKIRAGVFFGGASVEHEVSVITAMQAIGAMDETKYQVIPVYVSKAGEFYTPQEVSQILAEIVITGKTRLKSVYDPTCGSGSLLLRAAREGNADTIYGQEKNPTTFNLCRMNMLLHGIKYNNFEIHNDDTLERDELGDKQFDAVVANPPKSFIQRESKYSIAC